MDISYIFMLPVLEFFAKTLGGYGWSILGLTLAVRILVWPLVSASTKSMQAMSKLQPQMKAMQEKYKALPEDSDQVKQQKAAEMQKQMAEFYMKNKVNPFSGCLPMLVQLPILFALFGTFTGPPFQDKAIPVKVNIVAKDKADKTTVTMSASSSADSSYVSKEGKICKFVVRPGDATLVFGKQDNQDTKDGFNTVDYTVGVVQGEKPSDFKPIWKIGSDPKMATITPEGQAVFPCAGEITVAAVLPAGLSGSQEKLIPVKVHVVPGKKQEGPFAPQEDPIVEKKARSESTQNIDIDGKALKLAVEPGDMTVHAGKGASFHLAVVEGDANAKVPVQFKIIDDPNACSIDENGKAIFRHDGEIIVNAMIPGVAKDEPFLFMNSIGKVAKGNELFKPENFDVLGLILLFGVTMYLSQMLMVSTPPSDPEQAAVQKQTQQLMPITITAMFFFMPLPAGVYLYMVFSNVVQTLQTWLIMKSPSPEPAINNDRQANNVPENFEPTAFDKKKKKKEKERNLQDSGKDVIDVMPNDKKEKKSSQAGDSVENPVKIELKESDKERNK